MESVVHETFFLEVACIYVDGRFAEDARGVVAHPPFEFDGDVGQLLLQFFGRHFLRGNLFLIKYVYICGVGAACPGESEWRLRLMPGRHSRF